MNNYIILLTLLQRKQTHYLDWAQRFEGKSGGTGVQETMVSKLSVSPWRCSMIIWHADDMPEHIESMFDDCEYASDAGSVLRRASKSEVRWLARFSRERAREESETLDLGQLGLEKVLQVMSASLSCNYSLTQRLARSPCVHRAKCAASACC